MPWKTERTDLNVYSQGDIDKWVYSTCNICSIGCGCFIAVKNNQIVGVKGNAAHPANRGRLDPKAEWQWVPNQSSDRLLHPLIRGRSGKLLKATWDEAMDLFVGKVREVLRSAGPLGVAIYSTGQGMLEDYYTIAKIGRAGLGTHLLDANTRLCTATTEWCLLQSFGADGVPASYDDLDLAETVMLFGHNPAETGTVLFERIMERKKATGKPYLIVVDPRRTLTAQAADLFLQLYPGTNVALLNGLVHLLLQQGDIDPEFIHAHTVGFERVRQSTARWTPGLTSQISGVPVEQIRAAAHRLGKTPSLVTTTLQGAYQSADATTACVAINNLHLLRGLIGKPGCGPLHMSGQPSSSANRSVGGVGTYPGHRNPENPGHVADIARLWNVDPATLPIGPEIGIEEQIRLMEEGRLQLFWNIHTNPMVSLPNRRRARRAFEKAFVVVQDAFLTETTEVADIVLPAAMWGEKEGTMENADRRINLLRKAVDPPPGVRSDFEILLDFAGRMGFRDRDGRPLIQYRTPEECFREWAMVSKGTTVDMSGITYEKLEQANGLQWPVNEEHPQGTVRLYEDLHFPTSPDEAQTYGKDAFTGRARTREEFAALGANGKAILYATAYLPPAEQPNEEFPLWLTTGRLVWHWHTRTKTARVPYLHMAAPQGYVEIHPSDAERLELLPGEVVRVVSPRGSIEVPVRIIETILPGLVFVPFHFGSWQQNQAANELTVDLVDPLSKQPTYKQSSCRIEKRRQTVKLEAGDTLETAASRYGLTGEQLARINRLMPPYRADTLREITVPLSMADVVIPPYMPYREADVLPRFMQTQDAVTRLDEKERKPETRGGPEE